MFGREDLGRDPLTDKVIGAAIEVHKTLGPGLMESVYEQCFCYELSQRGLAFKRQAALPIKYKDLVIDGGLRVDIWVEDQLIVELKSVEKIAPVHEAQVLTYLKLSKARRALLINFNVMLLKDGIQRLVL